MARAKPAKAQTENRGELLLSLIGQLQRDHDAAAAAGNAAAAVNASGKIADLLQLKEHAGGLLAAAKGDERLSIVLTFSDDVRADRNPKTAPVADTDAAASNEDKQDDADDVLARRLLLLLEPGK